MFVRIVVHRLDGSIHRLHILDLARVILHAKKAFRRFVKRVLSKEKLALIREAAHFCQPVGDEEFKFRIEAEYEP